MLRVETDVSSTGMKRFSNNQASLKNLHFNVYKKWILKYIKECLKVITQLNEIYFSRFTSTQPLPPSLPIVPSPLCQLYQFHFGKNDDNEDVQIHSNETIAESEADVAGFCFF